MPYNNFYGYNPNYNNAEMTRISREIEDRENLLKQMKQNQAMQQQPPIQNIINSGTTKVDLEAKILADGQNINDIIVQNRTVFIDETNKRISIKEIDGTISKEYEIIVPLTAEQKEIEELKKTNNLLQTKLNNMEVMLNEYAKFNGDSKSTQDVIKSNAVDIGVSTTKSKRASKSVDE